MSTTIISMNGVEIGSAENIKFEINDDIKLDTPVVQTTTEM